MINNRLKIFSHNIVSQKALLKEWVMRYAKESPNADMVDISSVKKPSGGARYAANSGGRHQSGGDKKKKVVIIVAIAVAAVAVNSSPSILNLSPIAIVPAIVTVLDP